MYCVLVQYQLVTIIDCCINLFIQNSITLQPKWSNFAPFVAEFRVRWSVWYHLNLLTQWTALPVNQLLLAWNWLIQKNPPEVHYKVSQINWLDTWGNATKLAEGSLPRTSCVVSGYLLLELLCRQSLHFVHRHSATKTQQQHFPHYIPLAKYVSKADGTQSPSESFWMYLQCTCVYIDPNDKINRTLHVEWLWLQFWPKSKHAKASLHYTSRLKVKFMIQQWQFHKQHPDISTWIRSQVLWTYCFCLPKY